MAKLAEKYEAVEEVEHVAATPTRRLQVPDLERHGNWIIERLRQAFPYRNERELLGWLRGVIDSNDYCFLYQEHGVALATRVRNHPLEQRAHVQEIFCFARPGHEASAAAFYDDFKRWAKFSDIQVLVLSDLTDIPMDIIKDRLGLNRISTRMVQFVRLAV